MANIETWFEIHDTAVESLENIGYMSAENIHEVEQTRRVAQEKIRQHVGQVALSGLEESTIAWNEGGYNGGK